MSSATPLITNDAVHIYLSELTARVIAASGLPIDRFHIGKILLQSLKDAPEFVTQIDAATGQSETNGSVLNRSVKLAAALSKFGLKQGDVICILAPNHLDLVIAFYAALYLGVVTAAVDAGSGVYEMKDVLTSTEPKMLFCQSDKASTIRQALKELEMDSQIVTFDKGEEIDMAEFTEKYGGEIDVNDFKATNLESEDALALLLPTSGTTGVPKRASMSYKNLTLAFPYVWSMFYQYPYPTRMTLVLSPFQWLTASYNYLMAPILRVTRLQSSRPTSIDDICNMINTYKPTYTVMSTTLMTALLRTSEECVLSCFDLIAVGGSAVDFKVIEELKVKSPNTSIINAYGCTEACGALLNPTSFPLGSCGTPLGLFQYRLVNINDGKDINEPNVPGELWIKGPGVIQGYYKSPEATKEAFAEGGWFKTGDLLYRNETYHHFYVDRIKILIKYKSHHVSPVEVESVIHKHPGVLDVAVTSRPDPECGDLPIAFVIPRPGHQITETEIQDLVKSTLSDPKQLRGGVVFLKELPLTATGKLNRSKLKEMALTMARKF